MKSKWPVIKTYSASTVIREKLMNTIIRYHCTQLEWLNFKIKTDNNVSMKMWNTGNRLHRYGMQNGTNNKKRAGTVYKVIDTHSMI